MLNLAALLLADGGSTASQSWSFTVSVDDDTELSTGIPVNLYDQDDITMAVDWGDGSESTLTSYDYSALTDMEASIHTYSEAGEYTITLTSGDWSYFYFETNNSTSTGSDTGYYALYYFRKTLISIDTALPEVAGVRCRSSWTTTSASTYAGFYYMFCRCSALTSLPEGLFDNCTAVTNFQGTFFGCTSLVAIPGGLFANNTKVTTFTNAFRGCSLLESIPEGLFDSCTAVTSFQSTFFGCTPLAAIPEGLFDNNTKVTTFAQCFYDCTSLATIPEALFANNTKVTNFQSTFFGCTSLVAIPEGLFDSCTAVTTFMQCFYGCTSLVAIPGGLFDNNAKVTTFAYAFRGCSLLESIPEGLFDSCTAVTTFKGCFYNSFECSGSIHIGSEVVTSASDFMSDSDSYDRYVYVPAGSTTADTFNALSISGMTVVEE